MRAQVLLSQSFTMASWILSFLLFTLFRLHQTGAYHVPPNVPRGNPSYGGQSWGSIDFEQLVGFGDSYMDEMRYGYYASHGGQGPPPGTVLGVVRNSFYARHECLKGKFVLHSVYRHLFDTHSIA